MDSAYISADESIYDNNIADSEPEDCCCSAVRSTILTREDLDIGNPYQSSTPRPINQQDMSSQVADARKTITALLEAYGSLSVPQLLNLLGPDFTHRVLPESLGMPARDKTAFAQHAGGIFSVFERFRLVPVEVLKSSSTVGGGGGKDTWVVSAKMEGVLKGSKAEWKNECVMIVKMDETGVLVEEIQEFVDSAKAREMMKQHAPKDFGAEERPTTATGGGLPAFSFLTTFCWFLVSVVVAKMGAQVLALVMFWAYPHLEAFRRSFFVPPVQPRK
jgi:hypothetical protein